MAPTKSGSPTYLQLQEVFTPQQLQELVRHIQVSGELGRSKVYGTLLDYLVECSANQKTPKEFEIAVDGLGKNSDFDVSRDSTVRVYVHQLRKKLDNYYQSHAADSRYRIVIPKGQYAVVAISNRPMPEPGILHNAGLRRVGLNSALMVILIIVLAANLLSGLFSRDSNPPNPYLSIAESEIWQNLLNDDVPVLLVMGDYYIFGELNDNGNISRMVREFNINSRNDLEERHFSDWEATHNYQHLDLSYMPEGSAYALTRIIPILSSSGKRLNISMMSDLTTSDLRSNHIVYIGYISALDKLTDMVFAASVLQIGRSYDELLNVDTGRYYTSDAGLPEEGQQFRDYGFFSTFSASSENQVLIISGMRDAGLMHTAQVLTDIDNLDDLERELESTGQNSNIGLEALYEVFGMDRMNFDGSLIYSKNLDTNLIWGKNLTRLTN
ncbi:MAG: hypothetical protein JKY98_12975 [Gammaproteobacteria bacterium]|nr:hypothetical protein [Gammaproteobacteria bacterium]